MDEEGEGGATLLMSVTNNCRRLRFFRVSLRSSGKCAW